MSMSGCAAVDCPMKRAAAAWTAGDLEYFSWFGYSPFGVCPRCGAVWDDVMFAYDGPHCPLQ
jgi:hypothetical protein